MGAMCRSQALNDPALRQHLEPNLVACLTITTGLGLSSTFGP
jgi:hypothetical protein